MDKLVADWMTDGRTEIDHSRIDYARLSPFQLSEKFIEERCTETARKIDNPPVYPREPFAGGRGARRSPSHARQIALGGYFMELGGWERAHGYAASEQLLDKFGDRAPVRGNEWDNRHFWRVSNAEQLRMSEDCGVINLSHFHISDIEGPDHVALIEWLCVARIGGEARTRTSSSARASAGDAVRAGDDGQCRRPRRRALSGRGRGDRLQAALRFRKSQTPLLSRSPRCDGRRREAQRRPGVITFIPGRRARGAGAARTREAG